MEDEIRNALKESLNDQYWSLSAAWLAKQKDELLQEVIDHASPRNRHDIEKDLESTAGIYGPLSSVLGRIEDQSLRIQVNNLKHVKPSTENGQKLFADLWGRAKIKICGDYDFCAKRKQHEDDARLIATMAALLAKDFDWSQRVCVAVVVIAFYMGPRFICDCESGKVTGDKAKPAA